jgi:hypothetical protein
MADTEPVAKQTKKGLPTIAVVGIGCIGILVLAGIIMTIAGKVIFSKFGAGLLQKGIETKTGVKMDLTGGKEGVSFTDSKTGEKVSIGEQKIPDNFPKDFPIYPGAKPSGTMSGSNSQKDSIGFWVVFSTNDSVDKVKAYYEKEFKSKGWAIDNTMTINNSMTWTITKGDLAGTTVVGLGDNDTGTMITVMLGSKTDTTTPADGAGL